MRQLSNALRFLSIDMIEKARSGHPGMPMGMADVVTVLFRDVLHFCPHDPHWANRDRFILSAGHGSALLYSLLHLLGYERMTLNELRNYRRLGSLTPGHPERDVSLGVETTTGPLGQGLATAVGIALGQTLSPHLDYKTYVLAGDGDLMEGVSYEAASLAGHWKLNQLIVLWDDNNITIDGPAHLSRSEDTLKHFDSLGWQTLQADGHDENSISHALQQAQSSDRPVIIACRTQIGYGSPNKAGTSGCHGSPLGCDETAATRTALDWPYAPFDVPNSIRQQWASFWEKSRAKHAQSVSCIKPAMSAWLAALESACIPEDLATRVTSQHCLEALAPVEPLLIGGSADLTPSTNTKVKADMPYLHYGIREHAMAACMNGLALVGFIPYGGTYLVFSDYLRPALRLSALMHVRVIYVLTHDSIGVGEDGPTHQPIEHLSAIQAIPNMSVWRPCNTAETKAAWLHALIREDGPTCLVLSRQSISAPYVGRDAERGGYLIREIDRPEICLISSGSEVELCLQAADILQTQGMRTSVVSIPSLDHFRKQDVDWQNHVLRAKHRIVVEASEGMRWGIIKPDLFIGVSTFGTSAPGPDVYRYMGLTPEDIARHAAAVGGANHGTLNQRTIKTY